MNRFLIFILIVVTTQNIYSQKKYASDSKKAVKYYKEAIAAFNNRDLKAVKESLNLALKKDDNFIDAYLLRAELWRVSHNFDKQISDLKKAISIDAEYFPYVNYNLGMAQMEFGQYENAKHSFSSFLLLPNVREKSRLKAEEYIRKCDYALTLVENPVPFKPISLGDSINTLNDQYWPSLSIDGRYLYYSVLLVDSLHRTFTGDYAHQEDFYVSRHNNGSWGKGNPIGPPLNTSGNEGAMKISTDGNTIVFTACNREDGHGMCDIYFAYQTTTGWTRATNIRTPINTKYSEKQPCLSADGKTLFFSSNRPGGIGGMDIWYSEINRQGFWSEPINMGPTINTPKDEESPFLHPDNKTFYFSSDGHWGLGMKDIFISRKTDTSEWGQPKNIGYPVNTYTDEIGLIVDHTGETAYYSTNFNDSSRNIYQFTLPVDSRPSPVSYLKGKVSDIETGKPLEADIELLNPVSGKIIMNVTSLKQDGSFLICLPAGQKYALNASCYNYLFKSIHFNLTQLHPFDEPFEQNISLHPIKINEAIILENIFFASDSYDLLPESNAELKKIEKYILQNPNWVFEIGGHTDQTGSKDYNMDLSEKRAKTVYDYLILKNINKNNVTFKGYGELIPVSQNKSPEQKAQNRRTEIKIVKRVN
ncbi:MAG: OmpA family protein [Salinivirgaceae bacterium]|nr:OmpA family protein [Salinivirgaceae bacterium]